MENETENKMKPDNRWILHMDMDAFFAAVEQRDHEEYRGKPVIPQRCVYYLVFKIFLS